MQALNGVIFCDIALKGAALHFCLWEFNHELLKNNVHKHRPEGADIKLGPV